jgi:hypothetical protein
MFAGKEYSSKTGFEPDVSETSRPLGTSNCFAVSPLEIQNHYPKQHYML